MSDDDADGVRLLLTAFVLAAVYAAFSGGAGVEAAIVASILILGVGVTRRFVLDRLGGPVHYVRSRGTREIHGERFPPYEGDFL